MTISKYAEYFLFKEIKDWNIEDFVFYILSNEKLTFDQVTGHFGTVIDVVASMPPLSIAAKKKLEQLKNTKNLGKTIELQLQLNQQTQSQQQEQSQQQKPEQREQHKYENIIDNVDFKNVKQLTTNVYNQPSYKAARDNVFISTPINPKRDYRQIEDSPSIKPIKIKKKNQNFEFLPPGSHKGSPNRPTVTEQDQTSLNPIINIVLQDETPCNDINITNQYNCHQQSQGDNYYLNQLPCSFSFLKLAFKQDYDGFTDFIWNYKNGATISTLDQQMLEIMKYTLTDFHVNCHLPKSSLKSNERTSFCQLIIPIFKNFSAITKLISFTWCEKSMHTNKLLTFCLPDEIKDQFLLDGIGTTSSDLRERMLFESSGNNLSEHISGDTIKQINNTINTLKLDILYHRRSSFQTMKKRKTFGIHFINHKMTLTETFLTGEKKWAFILVRSAIIPTTFAKRKEFTKVFELVSTVLFLLNEQEKITEELEEENLGLIHVDEDDMIKNVLNNIN